MNKEKTIKIVLTTERWLTKEEYKLYRKEVFPLPINWDKVDKDGYYIFNVKKVRDDEEVRSQIQVIKL